jgi:hypothetical protein
VKSTPDEEGRRKKEEGRRKVEDALANLERYIPLAAAALARASGTSFRAGEVTADGKDRGDISPHFTSLHSPEM